MKKGQKFSIYSISGLAEISVLCYSDLAIEIASLSTQQSPINFAPNKKV